MIGWQEHVCHFVYLQVISRPKTTTLGSAVIKQCSYKLNIRIAADDTVHIIGINPSSKHGLLVRFGFYSLSDPGVSNKALCVSIRFHYANLSIK
jgi:hypothetical protein